MLHVTVLTMNIGLNRLNIAQLVSSHSQIILPALFDLLPVIGVGIGFGPPGLEVGDIGQGIPEGVDKSLVEISDSVVTIIQCVGDGRCIDNRT